MRRCERIPELELQLEQTRTNVDSGVPASASWHCLEELLTSYGVGGHRTCVIISGEWKAAAAESRASAAVSSQGDMPAQAQAQAVPEHLRHHLWCVESSCGREQGVCSSQLRWPTQRRAAR